MSTLATGGRITEEIVEVEIQRLKYDWMSYQQERPMNSCMLIVEAIGEDACNELDRFDQAQLNHVLTVCKKSRSLAEAGRSLFNVSRLSKANLNDSHRLRVYLKKFDLQFKDL
jgi:transcriptional regulatory protein RtcR